MTLLPYFGIGSMNGVSSWADSEKLLASIGGGTGGHPAVLVANAAGSIASAYVVIGSSLASGETIEIGLQKSTDGGNTWSNVHSETSVIDDSSARGDIVSLSLDASALSISPGGMFQIAANYQSTDVQNNPEDWAFLLETSPS